MSKPNCSAQECILAQAIYEIRILLSGYLGSEMQGDIDVRRAAHLAYALHNEAAAVVSGDSFDVVQALSSIDKVDAMLGSNFRDRFENLAASP